MDAATGSMSMAWDFCKSGTMHPFGQTAICLTKNLLKRKEEDERKIQKKTTKKTNKKKEDVYCPVLAVISPTPLLHRLLPADLYWSCDISADPVSSVIVYHWSALALRRLATQGKQFFAL